MRLKKVLTTVLVLSLFLSVMNSSNGNPKGKAEADTSEKSVCLPAEKIDKSKIKMYLSVFGTNFDVVEVEKSPISTLYKVIIKSGERYAVVYMDCKFQYVITGSMLDLNSKKDLTRETIVNYRIKAENEKMEKLKKLLKGKNLQELKKVLGINISQLKLVELKNVPKEGTIIYGNPDAKYTVYIISDPECSFCLKLHKSIKEIINKDKNVKFEVILFPLPFHKYAKGIAENIVTQSDMEKRKRLLEKSFEAVSNKNSSELEKLSQENEKGAKILEEHKRFSKSVNLQGTPVIIFPEGIAVHGVISTEALYKMIQMLRNK